MVKELNLSFPDATHVIVTLDGVNSGSLDFTNPLTEKDLRDIQWYVETYGAHSLGDPDDSEAVRIKEQLPVWGQKLFGAVFEKRAAERLLNRFQDAKGDARLLTISTEHPGILILPWELLRDPASGGGFLFMETPRISIRRRVEGATGGRGSFEIEAKDTLHLLFVISRPADASFLDPRADSLPVLEAIDAHAPGRVTWEFLRPPTLDDLIARLEDRTKTAVDIVHFDGHGVFDRDGGMPARAAEARATRSPREELLREAKPEPPGAAEYPPNTGYLLFEDKDGHSDFVSAEKLGANLQQHKVGLVILSACQSAAVEKQDTAAESEAETEAAKKPAMGSVAARLTATGIPSVLAMTHSVLVATTRILFGEFYKELARHKGIGESLDNARRYLYNHPEKFEVQRGPERKKLKLYDWFLPALYQPGADGPLLKAAVDGGQHLEAAPQKSNLPPTPEAGFFGRRHSLWQIERWFAGPTRRITITGFGGQGKTALAQEAGRWLLRTGLFRAAVFVDYSGIQTSNALGAAVANIGSVLGESLVDADAATEALKKAPTLVILDNLEALDAESLQELLSAAVPWSTAGGSRVLCTTRRPEFGHADYKVEGSLIHRRIALDGLGSRRVPDDALEWCATLLKLPPAPTVPAPKREALIELFDRVTFHPLSIRVLTQQLKTRRPAELGERLEQLLAMPQSGGEDTPVGLLASLELSLDKLDATARELLPRLGVFQGGAMESDLVVVTGLGDVGEREHLTSLLSAVEAGRAAAVFQAQGWAPPSEADVQRLAVELREKLAALPPLTANPWPALRRQLEAAALLQAEEIPGVRVPFLRFHPTLAPMLWAQLDAMEQTRWREAHRKRYRSRSKGLYGMDDSSPLQARAIAWRELPNLLRAVHSALDIGDPDAVDFANYILLFLRGFGLKHEAARLIAKAQAAAGRAGSRAWYLAQSRYGEQLSTDGHVAKAIQIYQTILAHLDGVPSYERAVTLGRLSQCFLESGRPDLAEQIARDSIAICDRLPPNDQVKRHRVGVMTEMATAALQQGRYAAAREVYQAALRVFEELGDLRSQGVVCNQLGIVALKEGNLSKAAELFQTSLLLFRRLREPMGEAAALHQLGRVCEEAKQWDQAERHYREAARIKEENGMIVGHNGAVTTWNQLAIINEALGKLDVAETWYRKTIEGGRKSGDMLLTSDALNNLADLLQKWPGRLTEARQFMEEALTIRKTLDPGRSEIWTAYNNLAQIADREAAMCLDAKKRLQLLAEARENRQLAHATKRQFSGTRHELQQFAPIILATVAACAGRADAREDLIQYRQKLEAASDWQSLFRIVDRILEGERDKVVLCEGFGPMSAMIVETILQGIADPDTLSDLLPATPSNEG